MKPETLNYKNYLISHPFNPFSPSMDPSFNNNPQYYPPPQQNPPSQQTYPQANPYQPPQQYPPTQQGYPSAPYQSPQQGYPSQYNQQQQPQIPNSTQNDLDQLDKGGFIWYRVALGIALLVALVDLINFSRSNSDLVSLVLCSFNFILIALVILQFLAMRDRNLQKAKIALIGFLSYISLYILGPFVMFLFAPSASDVFPILIFALIYIVLYGSLTLIGSFKVYQLLNENEIKSEPDFSQNQNQHQNQNQNYYAA